MTKKLSKKKFEEVTLYFSKSKVIDSQGSNSKKAMVSTLVMCFRYQQKEQYANDCKNEEITKKVSVLSNFPLRYEIEMDQNFQVLSLNILVLVKERDFKEKLMLISLHKKLVYLSFKVGNIEVAMLINTWAINSFMSPKCTKRLELAQELTKNVKILFA